MHLAYNALPDMWDEFCTTAVYLTNFIGTMANNGKTLYELWHSKLPSLPHLHEIGCRAYALIPTHNPKKFHHSILCILISYTSNSKAYVTPSAYLSATRLISCSILTLMCITGPSYRLPDLSAYAEISILSSYVCYFLICTILS